MVAFAAAEKNVTAAPPCIDCYEYMALTAKDKEARIMKRIFDSEYATFPNDWISLASNAASITDTDLNHTINLSFDRYSDEYPTKRTKVIHTHGTVASVRLDPIANNLGFTGLLAGAEHGVIRTSIVHDPYAPCVGVPFTDACFTPGTALKMFRDYTFSGNINTMYELGEGQGLNYNFMANQQKIWVPSVPGLAAWALQTIFSHAGSPPNKLSLDEFARKNANSKNPVYPDNAYFVPNPKLQFSTKPHEFRSDFKEVPVGTVLYTLVAGVDPATGKTGECLCKGAPCRKLEDSGCKVVPFAKLTTTSRFVASRYGDARLFFQHTRGDPKPRYMCEHDNGYSYPDTEEFRMADDHSMVCKADDSRPTGRCKNVYYSGCPFGHGYSAEKPVNHP